ncbi:hypothetical protein FACS1894211_10820 [Clostridia bacterium]|nr:hypothetical protein FACS1894211_10820 [Clostridia bacterium]
MKKSIKKLFILTGTALLAVALFAANLTGLIAVRAAFGDYQTVIAATGFQTEYELAAGGTPITVPSASNGFSAKVKGPGGEQDCVPGTVYTALYAGYYTIDYYNEVSTSPKKVATTRTLRFHVAAKDYSIEVDSDGADIPTYCTTLVDKTLPSARLIYTDAKGKVQAAETAENEKIKILVTGAGIQDINNLENKDGKKRTITSDQTFHSGKYFIKYYYVLPGNVTIQKEFTVTVDNAYTATSDTPTLSVSGVPDSGKLYTKITLPTATATDKRDTNVRITVAVTSPDTANSDKVYTVRDDKQLDEKSGYILDQYKAGTDFYADAAKTGNLVGFATSRDMTFYPHTLGGSADSAKYVVTYTATNDDGKQDIKSFPITVSETERPRIKIESGEIPSKWAMGTVKKRVQQLVNGVYDDVSPASPTKEWVYANLTDAEKSAHFDLYLPYFDKADDYVISNNVVAAQFTNVEVAYKKPGKNTYDILKKKGETDSNVKTVTDGFGVPKDYYVIPAGELRTSGDYEIRYTAERDNKSYSTAISYFTVTLVDTLEDVQQPYITVENLQKNVKISETFNKPAIKVSDNVGAVRSETRYFLYKNGGADVVAELDKDAFYNGKIDKFAWESATGLNDLLGTSGLLSEVKYDPINETDIPAVSVLPVGKANFNTATSIKVITYAVDAVGNKKKDIQSINLIDPTQGAVAPVLTSIVPVFGQPALASADLGDWDLSQGWYGIDSIVATLNKADDYMGYEIVVRKPSADGYGDIVDDMESTFWVDPYTNANARVLHVENFSFKPSVKGIYSIGVNVFDVTGATSSITLFLNVTGRTAGTENTASSTTVKLPATAEFGTSVSLPKKTYYYYDEADNQVYPEKVIESDAATYPAGWTQSQVQAAFPDGNLPYIYRTTVIGPHFSVSGRDLTSWANGEYRIIMKAGDYMTTTLNAPLSYGINPIDKPNMATTTDSFKSESTVSPVMQLTGLVPAKSEAIEKDVVIPNVIASSVSGVDSAKTVIEVSNGTTTIGVKDYAGVDPQYAGWKQFTPLKDGKYTVTYRVTANNGKETTQTYTVEIGDVFVPEIKLDAKYQYPTEAKVGDKFNFYPVTASDKYYEITNGVTTPEPKTKDITSKVDMKLKLNGDAKFNNATQGGDKIPDNKYTFDAPGDYTVEYTVKDDAGNEGIKTFTIKVTEKTKGKVISDKALAVIFSILGVVVIGGLVFYFVGVRRKNTR